MKITIGSRIIGQGERFLVVTEVAQAHDGSVGTAHAYIDAVASTGADAIKFQTHIAAAESKPSKLPARFVFRADPDSRAGAWMEWQ